jgi:transposase-like protein
MSTIKDDLERRRAIEDQLMALGAERERLTRDESWNRERVRRLVGPAREAGIKVREIARLTGLSAQTLHTWMMDLMRPIPDIHLALVGPPPTTLEQSVLRSIGEEPPDHEWHAAEARNRIPEAWPSGTVAEIDAALERLVRWHMIWDGNEGYRVGPPPELQTHADSRSG